MAQSVQKQITALIPYFGGDSSAAPSKKENRLDYLKRTVASLTFAKEIIVGVNNKDDAESITHLPVTVQLLDNEPQNIPYSLFTWARDSLPESAKYIYVTEADQVVHYRFNIHTLTDVKYLVPHRIEQLGDKGQGKDRGAIVVLDDKEWVIVNGLPRGLDYYHPERNTDQYGGAFLCTRELFNKVPFHITPSMPIEYATGLDIASVGYALKSSKWEDFFVEHLSGKEYHDSL